MTQIRWIFADKNVIIFYRKERKGFTQRTQRFNRKGRNVGTWRAASTNTNTTSPRWEYSPRRCRWAELTCGFQPIKVNG